MATTIRKQRERKLVLKSISPVGTLAYRTALFTLRVALSTSANII